MRTDNTGTTTTMTLHRRTLLRFGVGGAATAASAALLAIFFIPSIFGEIINNIFFTRWGNLLSLRAVIRAVWAGLFGIFERQSGRIEGMVNGRYLNIVLVEPPIWTAWLVLFLLAAVCLLVIARRVRAYEVVRG